MNFPPRVQLSVLLAFVVMVMGALHAQEANKSADQSPIRLTAELVDGSRLVGTTANSSIPLNADVSDKAISIPLNTVESLERMERSDEDFILTLRNQDQVTGTLDRDSISVSTLIGELELPIKHVRSIKVVRDSLDLTTVEPLKIVAEDPAYFSRNEIFHDGIEKPIRDGKVAERYLYAHAPTKITYQLDPHYRHFRAFGYLGSNAGKLKFVVVVDGKTRFTGPEQDTRSEIDIAVGLPEGAKTLELVVDSLGFKNNDHAFWLNPRLEK